jgi:site-specific recombinase XerD
VNYLEGRTFNFNPMSSSRASFSMSFYISRTKTKKNGEVPVYCKIYINGEKVNFQIKRYILPDKWITSASKMKGKTAEARIFNEYIDAIKVRGNNLYNELLKKYQEVSPLMLKNAILGKETYRVRKICDVWQDYIDKIVELIDKEISKSTVQKYKTGLKYFRMYLIKELNQTDLSLRSINSEVVEGYRSFLVVERKCGYNTTTKYLQIMKRITQFALNKDWMNIDPFANMSLTMKEVQRTYLAEDELQKIMSFKISVNRLSKVRDFFIFSCFTGLAYIDIQQLKGAHLIKNNNQYWIKTRRKKTGSMSNIPLLPVPLNIIKKYKVLEELSDEEYILPISSNQKVNNYLKELADLSGVEKELTFHMARHTFATTVTMMNGVPMESVSKMLGHKSIKTTQHYARIVDQKVENDMAILNQKLNDKLSFSA